MADQTIESVLEEKRVFPPSKEAGERAYIGSMEEYERLYRESIDDMEGFWARMADEMLDWDKKWDKVVEWDFKKPDVKWFINGKINASYNCLDRHLTTWRRNKAAIIWERGRRQLPYLHLSATLLRGEPLCQRPEE